MNNNQTIEKSWEEEIRQHFKEVYYGKDENGYGQYVSESAVEDFIQLASTLRQKERERILKDISDLINIHDPQSGKLASRIYWGNTLKKDLDDYAKSKGINLNN